MITYEGTIIQKDSRELTRKFKAALAAKDAEIERLRAIIATMQGKKGNANEPKYAAPSGAGEVSGPVGRL